MKSFLLYAAIASAIILSSCADKQIITPSSNYKNVVAGPAVILEANFDQPGESTSPPFVFQETDINAFPTGEFIIEEVYVYRDVEYIYRSLVISGERDLWIQVDKDSWIINQREFRVLLN